MISSSQFYEVDDALALLFLPSRKQTLRGPWLPPQKGNDVNYHQVPADGCELFRIRNESEFVLRATSISHVSRSHKSINCQLI
jgi:hypothetical protein